MKRNILLVALFVLVSGWLWALNFSSESGSEAALILEPDNTVIIRFKDENGALAPSRVTVQLDEGGKYTFGLIYDNKMKLGVRYDGEKNIYAHHSESDEGDVTLLDIDGNGLPDVKNVSTPDGFESYVLENPVEWIKQRR